MGGWGGFPAAKHSEITWTSTTRRKWYIQSQNWFFWHFLPSQSVAQGTKQALLPQLGLTVPRTTPRPPAGPLPRLLLRPLLPVHPPPWWGSLVRHRLLASAPGTHVGPWGPWRPVSAEPGAGTPSLLWELRAHRTVAPRADIWSLSRKRLSYGRDDPALCAVGRSEDQGFLPSPSYTAGLICSPGDYPETPPPPAHKGSPARPHSAAFGVTAPSSGGHAQGIGATQDCVWISVSASVC